MTRPSAVYRISGVGDLPWRLTEDLGRARSFERLFGDQSLVRGLVLRGLHLIFNKINSE